MKRFIRNILFAFRRFKLSAVLNLLGLSLAFAVFMIIMMQVYYDRTYNSSVPDADNIYLLSYNQDGQSNVFINAPMFDKVRTMSAHVKEASFVTPYLNEITVKINGNYVPLLKMEADTAFLKMMGCRMIAGSIKSIAEKNTVIIPESLALKYFGGIDIVGKRLSDDIDVQIGGIYKDFPDNCSAKNAVYIDSDFEYWLEQPSETSFAGIYRIDNPDAVAKLTASLDSLAEAEAREWKTEVKETYTFIPLSEVHYAKNLGNTILSEQVNQDTERILMSVAIVVLVIAFINFTNFSVALVPVRIKDVNTRKVFGATTKGLRGMLAGESVAIAVCSFLLSLLILWILSTTSVNNLSDAGISIAEYFPVVAATALSAIVLGVAAGLYPAIRLTSYSPAVALKGNFGLSPKGKFFRNTMICIQFFASSALIITAALISKQRDFLLHTDYGFDKDELIVFGTGMGVKDNLEAVTNEIKQLPEVENVAYSRFALGTSGGMMTWGRTINGKSIMFSSIPVTSGFLKTMGIKLLEGRDFLPNDTNAIIFNRAAQKELPREIQVGADAFGTRIIGICEDINHLALWNEASQPMALNCIKGWDNTSVGYARIRQGANMFDAMDGIRKIIRKYEPEFPNEIRLYDQMLERTYQKESRLTKMITLFSSLAVLISVMGVFGLVLFDSEYRKREIAVRKVFGSTTAGIIRMFNVKYLKILSVGFVISVPVAWHFVNEWMQNFAYRTTMSWWVFALAFVGQAVIIVATVTYQCYKIAQANPVESLKYE